jgi:hypothetical protein
VVLDRVPVTLHTIVLSKPDMQFTLRVQGLHGHWDQGIHPEIWS